MNFITSQNLTKFYGGKVLVTNQGRFFSVYVIKNQVYIDTAVDNITGGFDELFSCVTNVQMREKKMVMGLIQKIRLNYNIMIGNVLLIYNQMDVQKRHFLAEVINVNQQQIDVCFMSADGKRIPQLGLYSFPKNGPMSFMERFIPIQRGLDEDLRDLEKSESQHLYIASDSHMYSYPLMGYHLTQESILKHRQSLGLPMEAYVLPENIEVLEARVCDDLFRNISSQQ